MFCVQLLRLAHLCHSPRTLPVLTDPLKRRNNFCRVDAQCFRLQRMISHMKRAQILSEVPICPNSVHREACRGPVAQLIAGAPMTPSRPGRHPGRQVGWQHSHVETESASLALLPSCQRGYLVSRVSWWWACACWSPSQGVVEWSGSLWQSHLAVQIRLPAASLRLFSQPPCHPGSPHMSCCKQLRSAGFLHHLVPHCNRSCYKTRPLCHHYGVLREVVLHLQAVPPRFSYINII